MISTPASMARSMSPLSEVTTMDDSGSVPVPSRVGRPSIIASSATRWPVKVSFTMDAVSCEARISGSASEGPSKYKWKYTGSSSLAVFMVVAKARSCSMSSVRDWPLLPPPLRLFPSTITDCSARGRPASKKPLVISRHDANLVLRMAFSSLISPSNPGPRCEPPGPCPEEAQPAPCCASSSTLRTACSARHAFQSRILRSSPTLRRTRCCTMRATRGTAAASPKASCRAPLVCWPSPSCPSSTSSSSSSPPTSPCCGALETELLPSRARTLLASSARQSCWCCATSTPRSERRRRTRRCWFCLCRTTSRKSWSMRLCSS
mmetsp:Transcript_858/g.2774  ORF Transcript_858/g.2774 Transcript_858/m.2774 type:complete len:320 (-) Transcript_858:183-1142(-)